MTTGPALVRAYLDAFMDGRVNEFEQMLAPRFRFRFLPPILGEGPSQARRWRDILFSLYRDWAYKADDWRDDAGVIVVDISFVGLDPTESDLMPYFYDETVFRFEMADGRLAACDAVYLPFNAHPRASELQVMV